MRAQSAPSVVRGSSAEPGPAVDARDRADVEADLRGRVAALDLEQKARLLTGADSWTLHAEPAVGLRPVVTSDGPAGVRGTAWDERDPSANVPSPTALAATWDPERIEALGRLLAGEARRKGVHVLLAPTVNLHRTPYGGRHFECLSEDPLLTSAIGAAYVRGVQAGGVAATVKHFVANDSETQRMTYDARIDERTLRELYLAPFDALTREAGAWAVMAAYNGVNGSTMTESPLLQDVLRDDWAYDGLVMSDWTAARSTEATANAGLDLVMPGPDGPWGDALVEAVRAGQVPEAAVDEKVLRLLRLAGRVGALDGVAPVVDPAAPAAQPLPDGDVSAQLRTTAAAGFVLARNDGGLLPLRRAGLGSVAVLGPNAATPRTLGGGSATVFPPYTVSPLDGLRAALGDDVEVTHAEGVRAESKLPAATPGLVTDPDSGEPGLAVRFLAADGAVVATEHRSSGALNWMNGFGPHVDAARVAAVEVRARLTAARPGSYEVGLAGVGRYALRAGGEVVLEADVSLPPGADPIEHVLSPPERSTILDLAEGEQVELVLRHEVARSAMGTGFRVGIRPPHLPDDEELDRAVALAAAADVAIVVVGTTEEVESEGFDRGSLALPGRQDELVARVAAANPRTVAVVNAGAPVLLPWADDAAAVLLTWFPGQEYGAALADVLLGHVEPGGRLPTTWPAAEEGLPSPTPVNGVLAYDEGLAVGHRAGRRVPAPRYPFGHGLGYTSWEYAGIQAAGEVTAGDDVTVHLLLRNSGPRAGREVVQVYLSWLSGPTGSDPAPGVAYPARWLAGFAPVQGAPDSTARVSVVVPARSFAHWDGAAWTVQPGRYRLSAGASSAQLPLGTDVEVLPGPAR